MRSKRREGKREKGEERGRVPVVVLETEETADKSLLKYDSSFLMRCIQCHQAIGEGVSNKSRNREGEVEGERREKRRKKDTHRHTKGGRTSISSDMASASRLASSGASETFSFISLKR